MSNRVYYAVESVHLAECGTTSFTQIHGLQQCGLTTRFNLEHIHEIGQSEIYESYEGVPDVEATLEKVIDGYPLIYHLATKNSTSSSLQGRSNKRATLGLAIFDDAQDSASGTPVARCVMSGMYVSALNYNFNVQGPFTESVTLVGNNKVWNDAFTFTEFDNTDEPLAIAGSGGVQDRQDFIFGACDTSVAQPSATILPQDIYGISASGTNNLSTIGYTAKVQGIRVSTNLGRDQLFELGRKIPFHRYANFPVDVTSEIEVLSTNGDQISADESSSTNLTERRIFIRVLDGTRLDLGTNNKLDNVTYGGGNAGQQGSNRTTTYSYSNRSSLSVYHPQDPSGL